MNKKEFVIEINSKRKLFGDLRITPGREERMKNRLLIFCHGFKGFKNWGGWQYAMEKFCAAGFNVISMNFSGSGTGHDLINFTDLDRFAENTIGQEMDDIDFLLNQIPLNDEVFGDIHWDEYTKPKVGIIAHSRACPTVLLQTAKDNRMNGVVTWAGLASWERYKSMRDEWYEQGYIEMMNGRTKQMMRMNLTFLEDLEKNLDARDVLKAKAKLNIPHLIIHGTEDEAVPIADAELLYSVSNKDIQSKNCTQLKQIVGGNHTFGQTHPFEGSNPYFDEVINLTSEWFKEKL